MLKKTLSILLALVMVLALAVPTFAADFADTKGHANEDAIEILNTLDIINGYSETAYGPDDNLTRGQICAIMVRTMAEAEGVTIAKGAKTIFSDVPYNHPFRAEIDTAFRMGIINGMGNGTFAPEAYVTTDQMYTIALNTLGYEAPYLQGIWPTNVQELAYDLELNEDVPAAKLCTRAAAAQIIVNALDEFMVEYSGVAFKDTGIYLLNYLDIMTDIVETELGHINLAFIVYDEEAGDYVTKVTDIKLTTEVLGEYVEGTTVKIGNKSYDFKDAKRFYNGEEVKYLTTIKAEDKVTVVMFDDEVVAVRFTEYKTYTPNDIMYSGLDVSKIEGYEPGVSTVTVAGDDIKVSNKVVYGLIKELYERNDNIYIELAEGGTYVIENITNPAIAEGARVALFFDYMDNLADYKVLFS